MLDIRKLAEILGVSPATVRRLDAQGKIPEPVRLGRSVRWVHLEINRWLDAGCPTREKWAEIHKKH